MEARMRRDPITMLMAMPSRLAIGALLMIFSHGAGFAEDLCQGHKLLKSPRPASSCHVVGLRTYVSPDGELRASVIPTGVSLYATPDIESRVVIRSSKGDTLTSKDYSSPRGTNGYYVHEAKWTPDSQFFVFSMTSSGGHSPWSFPTMVYSRQKNQIASVSDMIDGKPLLSGDFQVTAPHSLTVSTWKQPGDLDHPVKLTIDLEKAFAKLPASAN
jgi:hypothetical protein